MSGERKTEAKPKLGRGLAALLGTPAEDITTGPPVPARQRRVPMEHIRPNPRNPRKSFAEGDLADLAASIKSRGVLQPVVVRAAPDAPEHFEIIAGERRWRAAQRAGVHELPVVVVEADDNTALELAIVENVQRTDLNAAEEARGYRALLSAHGYSQGDLAQTIGKSRSHVANTLRLLALPAPVLDMLESQEISAGHARALLAVADPQATARQIIERGLSVRDVEKLASDKAERATAPTRPPRAPDTDAKALSHTLTKQTGLKIAVERQGDGGRVTIEYKTLEQFDHVYAKLSEL